MCDAVSDARAAMAADPAAMAADPAAMAADPAADDALILVDARDRVVGTASKRDCHTQGLLHRAFSVVLVREGHAGWETLLVRRAEGKYHSGGLWTNACCSHPRKGEELVDAVTRRLEEELGLRDVPCREVGGFVYRTAFPNGIVEYEYDHVWLGLYDGEVAPDPAEASEARWVSFGELDEDLRCRPERYTCWCAEAFLRAEEALPLVGG